MWTKLSRSACTDVALYQFCRINQMAAVRCNNSLQVARYLQFRRSLSVKISHILREGNNTDDFFG